MFIAALFIIAKTWMQPRCPSVGERINKLWHIQTMEYYPVLKRNEPTSHGVTLNVLLSERSQSEKDTYCMIPITWHFGKGKTMETVKRSVVTRDWVGDRWIGRVQRIFKALQLFCTILQWWIYVIIYLSKPKECKIPRVNSNVLNYGLWVIITCQCRFMDCKKCTTLVADVDNGEAVSECVNGNLCTFCSVLLWM